MPALANRLAQKLAAGLSKVDQVRVAFPPDANILFAVLPRALCARLRVAGAVFHERYPAEMAAHLADHETVVRLVLSGSTPEADIEKFLDLARTRSGVPS